MTWPSRKIALRPISQPSWTCWRKSSAGVRRSSTSTRRTGRVCLVRPWAPWPNGATPTPGDHVGYSVPLALSWLYLHLVGRTALGSIREPTRDSVVKWPAPLRAHAGC